MSVITSYSLVHSPTEFKVQTNGSMMTISDNKSESLTAVIQAEENFCKVLVNPFRCNNHMCDMIMAGLENIFSLNLKFDFILVSGIDDCDSLADILKFSKETANTVKVNREDFFQSPYMWQYFANYQEPAKIYPERRPFKCGLQYKRFVPSLNKTVTFRTIDIERDLDIFHDWHNQPRVYDLWDLNKSKEDLKEYLEKGLKDPHQMPLIYEVDGEAVGYFEIYWVAEDRLAPYYECEPYDRGFHFLIGNKKYLGSVNTGVAVISVMHMIYLDDLRTNRIVVEPRDDNKKVIRYSELIPGWRFVKEFDFPHKRAALLMADRKPFFAGKNL